jgi:hypothetical protein
MATNNLHDGLFGANKKSIYDVQHQIKDDRKNLGRDFAKDIIFRNISASIYRNVYVRDFIVLLQDVLVKYIGAVTYLKIYKSYTVGKTYKKVK